MNTRILKEKIIHFNVLYVYFLEDGVVYRGSRKVGRHRYDSSKESSSDLFVLPSSIEKVEHFHGKNRGACSEKTAKALRRYGVEIV